MLSNTRPGWQERVMSEANRLFTDVAKLKAFLDGHNVSALDPEDLALLRAQYGFMQGYLDTLNKRTARFQ